MGGVSESVHCGNLLLSMNTLRGVNIPAHIQENGYRPLRLRDDRSGKQ
jgi:hypothetical protein